MRTEIAADGVPEVVITYEESVSNGWLSQGGIILPGHPLYAETLNAPSADILDSLRFGDSSNQRHIIFGRNGLMRPATETQLDAYIHEGEYDQRLTQI
ncbi:hypothetical protein N836_34095 [Leptolyngbya sp. Heron Island J]|uniref:hypothetical protein n=1 Tax=Leptolyngbya sp. Heron Island J TaxID=1385935 RepID=UPI0003B9A29B|nr:hypothetical protein [Leptolyngbya sp. Heron Island J]ESA37861.1 hypothetical protein N836_35160 [Leptolyngbya sp. Heron Island J]ESA38111.1 hypothetical protein N836_34095 [Leptolyngbya sp. Heron Island J]